MGKVRLSARRLGFEVLKAISFELVARGARARQQPGVVN